MNKNKRFFRKKINIPTACSEFQLLSKAYVWEKLPYELEAAYVRHLRACRECMEDLKAYHMFSTALHYLEKNDDDRVTADVNSMLVETERKIGEKRRRIRTVILGGVTVLVLILLFFLVFFREH